MRDGFRLRYKKVQEDNWKDGARKGEIMLDDHIAMCIGALTADPCSYADALTLMICHSTTHHMAPKNIQSTQSSSQTLSPSNLHFFPSAYSLNS